MFFQNIDLRNREAMISFLKNHYRYFTLNPWNLSTSYGNKMKIYAIGLSKEQENVAWALLEDEFALSEINELIHEFDMLHDFEWQAGFNGKSSGYLVLYKGSYDTKKYFKPIADGGYYSPFYNKRFSKNEAENHPCFDKIFFSPYAYPGKDVNQGEDFKDGWDMDSLRERVHLVQDFDRLCDDIVESFKCSCNDCLGSKKV